MYRTSPDIHVIKPKDLHTLDDGRWLNDEVFLYFKMKFKFIN
jgi:Ulp1 family protease